jgi:hypothetical protein
MNQSLKLYLQGLVLLIVSNLVPNGNSSGLMASKGVNNKET